MQRDLYAHTGRGGGAAAVVHHDNDDQLSKLNYRYRNCLETNVRAKSFFLK